MKNLLVIPLLYLRSVKEILCSRQLIVLCLIPYLMGLVSFVGSMVAFYYYKETVATWIVGSSSGWLATSVAWGFVFVNMLTSGIVAILVITLLCSWFMECLIEVALKRYGLLGEDDRSLLTIVKSVVRSLRDEGIRLIYICIILLVAFVVSFFPPLYLIPIILTGFMVGFDIIDLPLALLEMPFKERWRVIRRHKLQTCAFGGIFSISLLIPLGAILLLPIAYYAAVLLVERWDLAEAS
ncbi:EI24 domain-containing protein [Oligoflexia bacterium]|nr:EI24 domain-containing protein [Oligoflexia bacterium]